MFKLSDNSKNNRAGIDSRLIEISDLAITLTLIDFGHGRDSGVRTAERQRELFVDGKSKADGIQKHGKHQASPVDGLGKALDFYAYINGHASWEQEHLAVVACAFLQAASILGYQISWGGLWKKKTPSIYGWDMPHIELLED